MNIWDTTLDKYVGIKTGSNYKNNSNGYNNIKPFIKWAGGKSQIIDYIDKNLPSEINNEITTYIEPFIGGGAVLFHILKNYSFDRIIINDINEDLILTYKVIKNNVNDLIEELTNLRDSFLSLDSENREKLYYEIRDQFNFKEVDKVKRASQFIFLNKLCYNGLYRVNKNGKFNVPYGKYKNPSIFDKTNLIGISELLSDVDIYCNDFEKMERFADENTFIYLDPPYRPVSPTSSFTSYTKSSFNDNDQIRLSKFFKRCDNRGSKLMLSNSYSIDFFKKLYDGYIIKKIPAKRMINCKGDKRSSVFELLIMNYKI